VFEDNFEPPLALFDIHASRENHCPNGRRIFRENLCQVSNSRCFFKFANLKRNSSGYPSAMFLGYVCAQNAQEIADLSGDYFLGVYVRDNSQKDFIVDDGVEDSSTVWLI
jgi:hypothetical protein